MQQHYWPQAPAVNPYAAYYAQAPQAVAPPQQFYGAYPTMQVPQSVPTAYNPGFRTAGACGANYANYQSPSAGYDTDYDRMGGYDEVQPRTAGRTLPPALRAFKDKAVHYYRTQGKARGMTYRDVLKMFGRKKKGRGGKH
jgi:hypothetical protein